MKEAARNTVRVRVSLTVARKVMLAQRDLAKQGVEVERLHIKFKRDVVEIVKTVWLLYSILKEARNNWPAIRKALVNVGLSRYEITTLNLSQYTRKKPGKAKRRRKRRKV